MNDIVEAIDFLVDLICMMPPLDTVDMASIPKEIFMAVCLGSVFLLFVSILIRSTKDIFGGNVITVAVIAICIGLIGFLSLERSMLQGIFVIGYPPMVITLRGIEGLIIGKKYQPKANIWHFVLFLASAMILYIVLSPLPYSSLRIAKWLWAVLGALVASRGWAGKVSDHSTFDSQFSKIALFVVFLSTMLYVQSSPFDQLLFQWMFPIGGVAGFFIGKKGVEGRRQKSI